MAGAPGAPSGGRPGVSKPPRPTDDGSPVMEPGLSDAGAHSKGGDEQPSEVGPGATVPSAALRRTAVTVAKLVVVVAVASIALGGAAAVAATFYTQYGAVKNEPNAEAWAGLIPAFAGQASCTECHEPEAGAQDASAHVNVSCESCHGPAAAHAASEEAAETIELEKPDADICITCHAVTGGRPTTISQVDPASHFSGDDCFRCHDPHSILAVRPPLVTHPMAKLPECTTCHSPDGLKEIPSGHELVTDSVCLSCHARGASGLR